MIKSTLFLFAVAAVLADVAGCSPQPVPKTSRVSGLDAMFDVEELVVLANDGSRHVLYVYLATDHEQQRRGLMFVRDLPERTGMLFIYDDAAIHSMWMKNTYISLDIVFARRDGTVSSVIHDTVPLSLHPQRAVEPVNYVLELNAGVTRRLNIGPGSRLIREPNAADGN